MGFSIQQNYLILGSNSHLNQSDLLTLQIIIQFQFFIQPLFYINW